MTNLQNYFAHLSEFLGNRASRRNVVIVLLLLLAVGALVAIYSLLFHTFMAREGREHSWFTGLYWTLTVMSTLGFGDITFSSTAGRMFSMVVLLSGTVFILILLPFTVIQFIYLPWMETQSAFRTPRKLSSDVKGHVLLTHYDPVSSGLIRKLGQYEYDHVLLVADASEASHLADIGMNVVTGYLDDAATYRNVNVDSAAMVVMTGNDVINANLSFIVRQVSSTVPLVSTATEPASVDILEFAGVDKVLQLNDMMGTSLAKHARMRAAPASVIGEFDELAIAEANLAGTALVGRTLQEIGLRRNLGLSIAGIWERGRFEAALPGSTMDSETILVLAGSRLQIQEFNQLYRTHASGDSPIVVIGGGRVGRATAKALGEIGARTCIVEKVGERLKDGGNYIQGDAAEREVLEKAGIQNAPSVVITTHDDEVNLYLTMYCRSLCPDIQIVSRSAIERNAKKMHEAGADFVLSFASMGANAILSNLERSATVMVDEGLEVFKVKVPSSLVGKSISGSSIRRQSGCTVIAVGDDNGLRTNPEPSASFPPGAHWKRRVRTKVFGKVRHGMTTRHLTHVAALFSALIIWSGVPAVAEEPPMVRHTLLGDSLATRGLLDEALVEYESALDAGAGSARFLNRMGELYLRSEQFAKAVDTFHRSLREQPGQLPVYSKLGETYLAQSRLDSAIYYVEQASQLAPKATMVRSSLGGLYLKAGDLENAKAHLDTALLIDSANPEAHRFFGFYYTEQDSLTTARRHFESIIQSFPDDLEAHNNIAFLYAQERKYGLALDYYGRAKAKAKNAMEMHTLNLQIEAVRAIMDGKMRARYILVKTEAEARDLRMRAESGDDFGKMAQQFSIAANAPYGGDTDFFGSGDLLPQFEEAVLGLGIGAISDVVEVPLGFIIVQRTN